ncbi:MAG: PTS sugar transporter subunit IIC [Clostridia bacterium]|nr:PTS sugar transporter subunit IIC [Clostridia bacterium]
MTFAECKGSKQKVAWLLNYVFIDGMCGMALGLFATLIAGTIVWQIGNLINKATPNVFGMILESIGKIAQITMGAGIGVGVCVKMKKTKPLVIASACASGMIGSYAKNIILAVSSAVQPDGILSIVLSSAGDPMGAFIGSMTAMTLADLVSGKTRVDILITPLVGLLGGSVFGIGLGYPISLALGALGTFISWAASLSTLSAVITGLIIAVVMGICLTLPISSAAIGISIGLSGVAAGAAVVGCCCHMIGFATMSFRENGWGGAIAQGLGTSMLQIPNVFKKPLLFLPPVITSGVLGACSVLLPNGTDVLGLFATKVGSGMGTAGLVGPIDMIFEMIGNSGCNAGLTLLWVALFCFALPALLTLGISEIFRKIGLIKYGDLKLSL